MAQLRAARAGENMLRGRSGYGDGVPRPVAARIPARSASKGSNLAGAAGWEKQGLFRQPIARPFAQELRNPLATRDRLGEERHRLSQAVVRLGAAEAQEALAGVAEALAAQAGDAALVVGSFQ